MEERTRYEQGMTFLTGGFFSNLRKGARMEERTGYERAKILGYGPRRSDEYDQGMAFLEELDQLCRDHGYTIKGGEIVGYGRLLHEDEMEKLQAQVEDRAR